MGDGLPLGTFKCTRVDGDWTKGERERERQREDGSGLGTGWVGRLVGLLSRRQPVPSGLRPAREVPPPALRSVAEAVAPVTTLVGAPLQVVPLETTPTQPGHGRRVTRGSGTLVDESSADTRPVTGPAPVTCEADLEVRWSAPRRVPEWWTTPTVSGPLLSLAPRGPRGCDVAGR